MSENRFFSFILTEGLLLILLGLGMLIFPKVTSVSFGVMMCLAFVVYGGYKIIISFLAKNFTQHYILDIVSGLILFLSGVLLFFAPMANFICVIGLTGAYFVIKSLSSSAFSFQTKKMINFWWVCLILSLMEFIIGILIILIMLSGALWFAGIIAGIDFILTGLILTNMYISNKYLRNY